jgi:hypothetical protein
MSTFTMPAIWEQPYGTRNLSFQVVSNREMFIISVSNLRGRQKCYISQEVFPVGSTTFTHLWSITKNFLSRPASKTVATNSLEILLKRSI